MNNFQTIAAISTPLGESGLGVIRISGQETLRIISSLVRTKPTKIKPRLADLKLIWDDKKQRSIEQAIVTYYKSPNSYTGEDMAEISTHGSITLLRYVLEIILEKGARLATPGEFSKRAFLNGKMDLAQAEGVIELIKAKTKLSAGFAFEQVKGKLSGIIKRIREDLLDILTEVEVSLDFEEDMGITNPKKITKKLVTILKETKKLKKTYDEGKILSEGIKAVILGSPNVGKSTLLNVLLKENRALVTHIPGTTRDTIEEIINLNGIPMILIDTAGLQLTKNFIEKLGQERTIKMLKSCDMVLLVCEAKKGFTKRAENILKKINDKKTIMVYNKIDLCKRKVKTKKGFKNVKISAKKEIGIEQLKKEMIRMVGEGIFKQDDAIILNSRHYECLIRVEEAIERLLKVIKEGITLDICAIDLREAIVALGEISGEEISQEVINKIFEEFCVGK